MTVLDLSVVRRSRTEPIRFPVRRIVNAGYVGRDREAVKAHIAELEKEGVPPPGAVPALYPIAAHALTTGQRIEVADGRSSGEVEYVLLLSQGRSYVGVGSDHTDRELERHNVLKAKILCPNIMSREVWDYDEVRGHWDDLVLESWVNPDAGMPYQRGTAAAILSPNELLKLVTARIADGDTEGLVIFSGTLPSLHAATVYGTHFRCRLRDPVLNRQLTCEYDIVTLDYLRTAEPSHV